MGRPVGSSFSLFGLPPLPCRLPDAAAHLHQLAVVVTTRLAAVVENHGDARFGVVGFPFGESLRVRVARLDECYPDAADESLELVGFLRGTRHLRLTLCSMKGSSMPWDAPRALLSGFHVKR